MPVVVAVGDEGLERHDGVHRGDEAAVPHPHGVEPVRDLVLDDRHAAALRKYLLRWAKIF